MAKEPPEMHKYKIKNIANGPVHVKELRRAISAGKEVEFIGVLSEGTKRLEQKEFLSIKDLGVARPEELPKKRGLDPLQRKAAQVEKERELTNVVREKLAEARKEEEPKAKVEEVSASEMGVEDKAEEPKAKSKRASKSVAEVRAEKSGLDALVAGQKSKTEDKSD